MWLRIFYPSYLPISKHFTTLNTLHYLEKKSYVCKLRKALTSQHGFQILQYGRKKKQSRCVWTFCFFPNSHTGITSYCGRFSGVLRDQSFIISCKSDSFILDKCSFFIITLCSTYISPAPHASYHVQRPCTYEILSLPPQGYCSLFTLWLYIV